MSRYLHIEYQTNYTVNDLMYNGVILKPNAHHIIVYTMSQLIKYNILSNYIPPV